MTFGDIRTQTLSEKSSISLILRMAQRRLTRFERERLTLVNTTKLLDAFDVEVLSEVSHVSDPPFGCLLEFWVRIFVHGGWHHILIVSKDPDMMMRSPLFFVPTLWYPALEYSPSMTLIHLLYDIGATVLKEPVKASLPRSPDEMIMDWLPDQIISGDRKHEIDELVKTRLLVGSMPFRLVAEPRVLDGNFGYRLHAEIRADGQVLSVLTMCFDESIDCRVLHFVHANDKVAGPFVRTQSSLANQYVHLALDWQQK